MHKLDRSQVEAPPCLESCDYRSQTWDDLGADCKQQVRRQLAAMQGRPVAASDEPSPATTNVRCAYCEKELHTDSHIEHFRRRKHHRHLTFEWSNLFLSCNGPTHCGHFKDRPSAPAYDPDLLIKPDQDDPDHFLFFHSSGKVSPRQDLSAVDRGRAEETIRVFGLNAPSLKGERRKAVQRYRDRMMGDLEEIADWSEDLRRAYLLQEVAETRWDPYATTIKHFLLPPET